MRKPAIYFFVFILFIGSLMRFIDGGVSFFDDEADFLVQIHSIDLKNFHFPLASVGHSPLSLYITKLSSIFFGETELGYRFILLVINVLLIWLVYLLTRQKMGEAEGIFAAFLISVNSFVIYYSREIGCDGYFLFFSALVIYFFFQAVETQSEKSMIGCGLMMGLALLNKAMSLLLVPGFVLYLLINKQRREWFKRKSLYLAILISLIMLSPYLFWLNANGWSHFKINEHYFQFFNVPISALVFLGSIFKIGIYPHANSFGREYMSLGMGLLLILGVVATIHQSKRNNLIQLMQLIFWSIIGVSLVFFRGWPVHYNLCILPAVILTAFFLSSLWANSRLAKILILVLCTAHLSQMPKYLSDIEAAYDYHSSLSTRSQLFPENVNLNTISSALIPLIAKYQPTLIVTPNPEWDTIACYLGAQTKIKTLAPIPLVYDSIVYNLSDWQRVLIIDDNRSMLASYARWAENNMHYGGQLREEQIYFNSGGRSYSVSVAALLLSAKRSQLSSDILRKAKIDDFIISSLK